MLHFMWELLTPESEKNETEILLLDTKSEEEDTGLSVRSGSKTAKELEVRLIAQRIGELMESQQIVDKETGMLRPVRYQDIVILTKKPCRMDRYCYTNFAGGGITGSG